MDESKNPVSSPQTYANLYVGFGKPGWKASFARMVASVSCESILRILN